MDLHYTSLNGLADTVSDLIPITINVIQISRFNGLMVFLCKYMDFIIPGCVVWADTLNDLIIIVRKFDLCFMFQ